MKYGYKCISKMSGTTFFIIENSEAECIQALNEFKSFLSGNINKWGDYCYDNKVFCYDDVNYNFTVGKTESGTYVLITDLGCKSDEENKVIEFILLDTFIDRF